MPVIEWNITLAVGIPELDGQHAQLIEVLNDSRADLVGSRGGHAAEVALARIVTYTREHFVFEERLMTQVRFPGLPAHKREHERLLARAVEFQGQVAAGTAPFSNRSMEFAKTWLLEHIAGPDRTFGDFLAKTMSNPLAGDGESHSGSPSGVMRKSTPTRS